MPIPCNCRVDPTIAPTIINKLLLPLFRSAIKYFACLVQAIQAVIAILLPAHRLAGNVNLLFSQIAIVVSHARAGTDPGAVVTVVVYDRTAIGGEVSWTSVAGAFPDLRELPAAVVEEFIVDWRRRSELLFHQAAYRRIQHAARVGAINAVAETAAKGRQATRLIVDVVDRTAGRISQSIQSS